MQILQQQQQFGSMIGQSVQSVRRLIEQSAHCVPQLLFKFYAFLRAVALQLNQKVDFEVTTLFGQALLFFRKCLVDEPFLLSKLKLNKLHQSSQQPLKELAAIREQFFRLKLALLCQTPVERLIVQQFKQWNWSSSLLGKLQVGQAVLNETRAKGKNQDFALGEMTVACWYSQFKQQYMVSTTRFLQYFCAFAQQHLPILIIIKPVATQLRMLLDPQSKHFVTVHNCHDLLLRLRDPLILEKISKQPIQKEQEQVQKHQLSIRLTSQSLTVKEHIKIYADTVTIGQKSNKLNNPSVVMVGSSAEADMVVQSKYVSRKQLMILQQQQAKIKQKQQDVQKRCFSLVCLSLSNFTAVKYPKPVKVTVGTMFYAHQVKYQVLSIARKSLSTQSESDQQRTLTLLPSASTSSSSSVKQTAALTLYVMSGQDKDKQIAVEMEQLGKPSTDMHHKALGQVLLWKQAVWLRQGNKVLLKSANEVVQGRMSKRIPIIAGMQVCLEEFLLTFE